jgi:hypothetical protein
MFIPPELCQPKDLLRLMVVGTKLVKGGPRIPWLTQPARQRRPNPDFKSTPWPKLVQKAVRICDRQLQVLRRTSVNVELIVSVKDTFPGVVRTVKAGSP